MKKFIGVVCAILCGVLIWAVIFIPRNAADAPRRANKIAPFLGTTIYCDVLVVGGTPSGVAAALAAARRGANVVLIEERPALGGDIVYAMLNMFDVPMRADGSSPAANGIFGEFYNELGIAFDIERAHRLFAAKVAAEPNIQTFRSTRVARVMKNGARVTGAMLEPARAEPLQTEPLQTAPKKPPALRVLAHAVVDATNDADFAARAGAHFFIGRQSSGRDKKMQSASLLFSVSGAHWRAMKRYVRTVKWMPAANRIGQEYASDVAPTTSKEVAASVTNTTPTKPILHRMGGVDGGYIWERGDVVKAYHPRGADMMAMSINFGRQDGGNVVLNTLNIVNVNGLDFKSKKRARGQAIAELQYFLPYLRGAMPGLEDIELAQIAPELYIRETRHLQGFYTLTVADIRAQKRFPDRIALVSYPIDLHPYQKGDKNPYGPKRYLYTLPLRALVPRTIDGVFVASRCLSATYSAAGSARVIPITMAAGEAAGTAAWLCASQKVTPHQIAKYPTWWKRVRNSLRQHGTNLGDKIPTQTK